MLPLCVTYLSIIREDKFIPFYTEVDKWWNIYACQIGLGGSYVHGFKTEKIYKTVYHYGCIVREDGVQGGTSGAIVTAERWVLDTIITLHRGWTIGDISK